MAVHGCDRDRTISVLAECAMALCNVLCQVETQHRILELNALSAFIALARCSSEEIQMK
jgi:hypothetical protein